MKIVFRHVFEGLLIDGGGPMPLWTLATIPWEGGPGQLSMSLGVSQEKLCSLLQKILFIMAGSRVCWKTAF